MQEGWARFLGATLLASNYHLPVNGQIGSGIYDGSGVINYTSSPDSGTRLVVSQIGGNENSNLIDFYSNSVSKSTVITFKISLSIQIFFDENKISLKARWMEPHGMLYEDLTNYSNMELITGEAQTVSLCHDDLCCHLNYSIVCPQHTSELCDQYRLFSYSGFRTLGGGMYTVNIQVWG